MNYEGNKIKQNATQKQKLNPIKNVWVIKTIRNTSTINDQWIKSRIMFCVKNSQRQFQQNSLYMYLDESNKQ